MSSESPRILLIDDEPVILKSLALYLEDHDYVIQKAVSGIEAAELAKDGVYALAIVDMCMPGCDGETLIRLLHETQPAMRFLIHTGSGDYRLAPDLSAIGIRTEDVLYKPVINLNEFIIAIDRALARR